MSSQATTVAPTRTARLSAWFAMVAVAAAVLVAPPHALVLLPGEAGRVVHGTVEVLRDGRWRAAPPGSSLRHDEPVRAVTGEARLQLLRAAITLADGTRVLLSGDAVALELGAVLVDGNQLVDVSWRRAVARGRGTWRFDVWPAPRVAVYDGGVAVTVGGRAAAVGAFEQVGVEGGELGDVVPVRYLDTDRWDQRHLAAALAADRHVAAVAASLRAVHGTELRPAGFYRALLGPDEVLLAALPSLAPRDRAGRFGPPAETLLAAAVTLLLSERAGLSIGEAIAEVRTLRQQGATWGLILLRRDAAAVDLGQVAADFLASGRQVSDGGRPGGVVTEAPVRSPHAGGPQRSATPSNRPTPTGTPSPSPSPRPSPTPHPSPEPSPGPPPPRGDDPTPPPPPAPLPPPGGIDELLDPLLDLLPP